VQNNLCNEGEGNLQQWHPLDELFVAPEVFPFYFCFALGNDKGFVLLLFHFAPGDSSDCQGIIAQASNAGWLQVDSYFHHMTFFQHFLQLLCNQGKVQTGKKPK